MSVAVADIALIESQEYCHALTKRAARNFYYGLKLLPEPKRSAMFALYTYLRLVDDIADAEDGRDLPRRLADLDAWRDCTHAACRGLGVPDGHPVWPAFADLVQRYGIPEKVFDEMIEGQRQDLAPASMETFKQLYDYCYRVASVVGLASIYVWGFEGGESTEQLAVERGIAFQLTNILRDLREDGARGRVYLPREELVRFGIGEGQLVSGVVNDAFLNLMHFQINRAEKFYVGSAALEQRVEPDSRATLVAMTAIYHGLLEKMSRDPGRVARERVRLSGAKKLSIALRAMLAGRKGKA